MATKKRKRASVKRRRSSVRRKPVKNPTVYDAAGKKVGKFKRATAKLIARAVSGTVGKPSSRNPHTMRFKTKAAVLKYAAAHGLRVKSIRKATKRK